MKIPVTTLSFEHLVALTTLPLSYDWESKGKALDPGAGVPPPQRAQQELAEIALAAGQVDLYRPLDREGNGLAVVWGRQWRAKLPVALLVGMEKTHPRLGQPNAKGDWPLAVLAKEWIGATLDSYQKQPWLPALQHWLENLGPSAWQSWDREGDQPGEGLLRWLGKQPPVNSSSDATNWNEWVELARTRGVEWTEAVETVSQINNPQLQAALVEAGVDLQATCGPQATPLWRILLDRRRPLLTEAISRIMRETSVAQSPIARETEVAGYLENFTRVSSSAPKTKSVSEIRNELLQHLQSRKDWHLVQDSDGRSAFFHALLASPGVLRTALERLVARDASPEEREQWRTALTHRDAKGRNVWFYILGVCRDNTFTEKMVEAVRGIVPSPYDEQGRGWAYQIFNDIPNAQRCWALPGKTKSRYDWIPLPERKDSLYPVFERCAATGLSPVELRDLGATCILNFPCSQPLLRDYPVQAAWVEPAHAWFSLLNNMSDLGKKTLDSLSTEPGAVDFPLSETSIEKLVNKHLRKNGSVVLDQNMQTQIERFRILARTSLLQQTISPAGPARRGPRI